MLSPKVEGEARRRDPGEDEVVEPTPIVELPSRSLGRQDLRLQDRGGGGGEQ